MTDTARQAARVVIALESAVQDLTVLDILRCMIGESLPELLGLMIEDEELLGFARSRLAREVVLSGATRPLDSAVLHRQLRARSGALRKRFESVAAQYGMRSEWQLGGGDMLGELATQAQKTETLAINMAAATTHRISVWSRTFRQIGTGRVRTLLLAREGWRTGSHVLVVATPGADVERLLAAARTLARHSGSTLGVLLIGEPADRDEMRRRIAELGGEKPDLAVQTMAAENWSPGDTAKAVATQHARLLIVPWPSSDDEADALAELLSRTRCAVLLIR
jgi:hypothetical protein